MVSTQEVIAFAEIGVYTPIFFLTFFVLFRNGFQKQLGWIYLAVFCVIRVAGAGFKIAETKNPRNATDIEWASILLSVGLSPLLMASLGLLKQVTDAVSNRVRSKSDTHSGLAASSHLMRLVTKRGDADSRRSRIIQIAQLPTLIALVLCIIGGLDESDMTASEISTGKKLIKIGICIFLVIYLLLLALVVITMRDAGSAPPGEKRIYSAVVTALPLLAVRLLWSLLSAFTNNADFSQYSSKPLIQLFMAIIEEFVIVCCYTLVGLLL